MSLKNMSLKKMIAAVLTCATLSVGVAAPASASVPLVAVETTNAGAAQQVDVRVGFYVRGGDRYYNGKRGYRSYRQGYRQYNGFWFPRTAFIIGNVRPYGQERSYSRRMTRDHVSWCNDRYRSYRSYDNSYQPYGGPRRACRSPYM